MTFVELLNGIQVNVHDLCSRNSNATPAETLRTISGLEGFVSLLKSKIGLTDSDLERDEELLTNGDIFMRDGIYAYAEMPTGQKKWFKKVNEQWEMLDYDTSSLQEEVCSDHARELSKALDVRLQNVFWPTSGVRRN